MSISNPEENLTLGRGIFYFNKKNPATGLYEGHRDLGNCPELSINIAPEKLAHYSSRGGLKVKDREIIKEITLKFSFNLDEPNVENLAMVFMADRENIAQPAATDATHDIALPTKGRHFNIGNRNITVDEIALTSDPTTIYVEGTDYTVDAANGRIYIVPGGSITGSESITITYDAALTEYTTLKALNQPVVEGELQFISDNPAGKNYNMRIWRASIIPSGNLGMISDDWMSLAFEAEILKDEAGHSDSPYMSIDTLID